MALQNIDFRPIQQASNTLFEAQTSYDPANGFVDGALKGIELRHQKEANDRAKEKHEMQKDEAGRRGALHELNMKVKSKELDVKDKQLEIESEKAKHAGDLAEAQAREAEARARKAEVDARKSAEELAYTEELTTEQMSRLGTKIAVETQAIKNAPDTETKQLMVDRINLGIKQNKRLSKLFPNGITTDEQSLDEYAMYGDQLTDVADKMKNERTWKDESGNLWGYGSGGEPKMLKTAKQLAENQFNPSPLIDEKKIDGIKSEVWYLYEQMKNAMPVEYVVPESKKGRLKTELAAMYGGHVKEYERLNKPIPSREKLMREVFFDVYNANKFEKKTIDGVEKMVYNPAMPAETGKYDAGNGRSIDVQIMGRAKDSGGNIVYKVRFNGELFSISEQDYKNRFTRAE